jgi:high-affinity K+ transport system ATPase subunit B
MAQVICTEMLEAAAIALKDVIKQSIVQRLKKLSSLFHTKQCYVTMNNQLINAI